MVFSQKDALTVLKTCVADVHEHLKLAIQVYDPRKAQSRREWY